MKFDIQSETEDQLKIEAGINPTSTVGEFKIKCSCGEQWFGKLKWIYDFLHFGLSADSGFG